jgi:hypothetical protein
MEWPYAISEPVGGGQGFPLPETFEEAETFWRLISIFTEFHWVTIFHLLTIVSNYCITDRRWFLLESTGFWTQIKENQYAYDIIVPPRMQQQGKEKNLPNMS